MKESNVVTALLQGLRQHGFFWKASDRYHAGIPDIIGCHGGRFVGIEVKIDTNKPTPLQVYYIEKIREAGGYSDVVTYSNKTKKYNIQKKEMNKKDIIQCILKQIVSSTSTNVSPQ